MPSVQQIVWSIGCHDRAYVNDRLHRFLYPNASAVPYRFSASLFVISVDVVFFLVLVDGNLPLDATLFLAFDLIRSAQFSWHLFFS